MLFLQLWLTGSIGFVLGWVVRFALAKRMAENPTSEVHTIDLRAVPGHGTLRRRMAPRAKSGTDTSFQINLN